MTNSVVTLERTGRLLMRGSLVFFFLAFGLYKFTAVEAEAIRSLMENSPFFAWLPAALGLQGASNAIGVVEIVAAVLVASRRWTPGLCALALVATLSFLFTTPGLTPDLQGFLLKDLALLGIALWTAAEALGAARTQGASGWLREATV